jgi:VWFA-related protein
VKRLLLISLAAGVWAQAPAPDSQSEVVSHDAPATFSTRVNLVSVPVVVRDKKGNAVGGLRKEDFQLFDKGKLQEITKFTVETGTAPAVDAAPEVRAPDAPALPAPAAAPIIANRFVAYIFDDVHMKPADLLNARQAANKHLDASPDPYMRAAIFTTSGANGVDFTDDRAKLHATINSIKPSSHGTDRNQDCPYVSFYAADWLINKTGLLSPVAKDPGGDSDDILRAVLDETAICVGTTNPQVVLPAARAATQNALRYGQMETETALNSLREIVRRVSIMPGSRSIVLVSPGFFMLNESRFDESDLLDRAIKASITINTLDIRGLYTPAGTDASERAYNSASAVALARADSAEQFAQADVLAEVADGTGGTFFHNDNGLEEGLKQLAAKPEYTYVLGFSPQNLKLDGSYHGLKVSVKSTPGLEARARRGYWAPNHKVDPAEQSREEIREAVFSLEEMSDIPVELTTEFFKSSESSAQLTVSARVGVGSLKFRKTDDRNRDTLTVVTGLFDQNGRFLKGIERTIDFRLRDQTLEKAAGAGMSAKASFDVPPGRYVVRVVVRDSEGQSMASRNGTVDIQ